MKYFKLLALSAFCMPALASETELDYFTFSFENDVFYHEDGGYSNGLIVNWGYDDLTALNESTLPAWINYLTNKTYLNDLEDRQYSVNYKIGHFVQTASEIKTAKLVKEDAPYVGLLAWEVNASAYNTKKVDDLSLTLGVVGPLAGGEFLQKNIHSLIGANEPMGWDNQIHNEPVFRVQARRLWRNFDMAIGSTEVDVITGVKAGVGNLLSDANAGVGFRWGQKLAANFASSTPFVTEKFNDLKADRNGWYLFSNLSAGYVLNDIFMNGNTFQDSHSVDLIHWQAGLSVGAQINLYNWNFIYTMIYTTDQYESQTEDTRFGTVSITYNF